MLLSLATPALAILQPNPLPPTASSAALKYPFVALRKSLRLLIDDNPEALDEVENDISFVYSGYAPISVRLVQCVAQKGGVISNPAEKDKAGNEGTSGGKSTSSLGKVQAHPIVGWKGFEDVVSVIPGATVEIVQKTSNNVVIPSGPLAGLGEFFYPEGDIIFNRYLNKIFMQGHRVKPAQPLLCFSWEDALILKLLQFDGLGDKTKASMLCCSFIIQVENAEPFMSRTKIYDCYYWYY